MGGNTRAIDRETGRVLALADRVDFRVEPREAFRLAFYQLFRDLNEAHWDRWREQIWLDPARLFGLTDGAHGVNGSAAHVFGNEISDSELLRFKPTLGDVDVTVPHHVLKNLFLTLAGLEGRDVTPSVKYLGQNKKAQHGHQINALFEYRGKARPWNVQVDFEGVRYSGGEPDAFSRFAHSSSWEDTRLGIKGVAHKYWLTNLVRARFEKPNALVLTEKSPAPPHVRLRALHEPPRLYSFSVDRGLRMKLSRVKHDGKNFSIDGKPVYRELSTAESTYVTDLKGIYERVFGHAPTAAALKRMWSFVGLVEHTWWFVPRKTVRRAFEYMVEKNLYGDGAQKLDRVSSEGDRETKAKMVAYLIERFPYLKKVGHEAKAATYYEAY